MRSLLHKHHSVKLILNFCSLRPPTVLLNSGISGAQKKQVENLRQDTSDHTKHEGPPRNPEKPILCFDTSRDSRVVCAGTEQVGQDAYLLFWDMRAGPLMGGYWESHEDDITCIKFHPEKNDSMASGSTDGLVNVFDLNEGKEDDALLTCHNTEDSVSSLHWFSKKNNLRYLGIATHTESIQLWDTDDYQPYQTIARSDVCHSIRRTVPEHSYIVGMHDQEEQGFLVLAGSRYSLDPCLRLTTLKNKKLKPCGDLKDGKVGGGIVRCSAQLPSYSGFITGSEGGVVAVWRTGDQPAVQQITETFKIKNKISKRDNPY
ncbi:WD repeat-containing protein 89 isoform X2 [Eurytemora carolleeae]|uniref:WD repeat-containing protein 89 isoform X2 n=1 Tax=Eurytemora carolleeae TaxID=1294199 RepID=UPI000C77E52A|nr:WD repeat-containing protein 89 isoform X2 [Eurytemora carolleeae]|eukprot:XP_023321139.1 WD repeat-containing protein 89-like isoform X2 [Eurytemora affinis]